MTWFGQSKMVTKRNQPSLFDPQNSRDMAGTNRDNRDNLALAETRQPGQSGTPPLKGGVQCPAGTVSRMSRVPCPGSQSLENRNDNRAAIFAAWVAECKAYDAVGRQDEVPPLPPGYLSSGPRLWREGAAHGAKKWR